MPVLLLLAAALRSSCRLGGVREAIGGKSDAETRDPMLQALDGFACLFVFFRVDVRALRLRGRRSERGAPLWT